MSHSFRQNIRNALANGTLQFALDGNAERRLNARQESYASLSDSFENLKQRAHQVRLDTIQNLDEYLEQFTQQASANGILIHKAENSARAVEIVLEIARQSGAKLIAKSKTMVGEEIQINQALEAGSFKVVETDLGEYIVQLRGEPPAHIITPAVHLTRQQVGHTFEEKLGIDYSEDISYLTAAARQVLRQTFLETDIGISGVNFGVAQTGTICLLTNEGNGRMVTTLPRIHIALMGMERLVPSLSDLTLMLELLPRSATGQKLTVYTSLIHGPRRAGEIDGPEQRHLVLLDNGRSALKGSSLAEMLCCIRCGACLNACPVFREIGGHAYVSDQGENTPYPGPMGSVLSPGLFGLSKFGALAHASSLCGACQEACPVDIPLPKLLLRVRAAAEDPQAGLAPVQPDQGKHSPIPPALKTGLRFFAWMTASPWRFRAAQWLAGLGAGLFFPRSAWLRLPGFSGWGLSRDFPRPAKKTFREMFEENSLPGTPGKYKPALRDEQKQASQASQQQKLSETPHQNRADAAQPLIEKLLEQSANSETQPPSGTGAEQQELKVEGKPSSDNSSLPVSASYPGITEQHLSLLEKFTTEIHALGGLVKYCSQQQAGDYILGLLREMGVQTVHAWAAEHLPVEVVEALQKGGVNLQLMPDPHLKVGLTGALGACADTGSLAIASAPGRPLTASLLPETHIACLYTSQLLPSLAELLSQPWITQAANTVLISGPSRTADIEMTLTIGVHGPGQLIVVCIEESPSPN